MQYRLDKPALYIKGDERRGTDWFFRFLTLPVRI